MIHLGDRLGLYPALADADGPLSTDDLAARTGLQERWVREWAYNQGAAGVILVDAEERLSLTPVAAAVLADPDHPAYAMGPFSHLPGDMGMLDGLPESFRTGVGVDYDAHGPGCAAGIARGFEPWMRTYLLSDVVRRRRRRGPVAIGDHRRRRRLRSGRDGAALRRGLPGVDGAGL